MKNNSIKEFEEGESYLVFMGYDYSPSGFDEWTDRLEFYELPKR